MSTAAAASSAGSRAARAPKRLVLSLGVLALWIIGYLLLNGRQVLPLGATETTGLHRSLNHVSSSIGDNRNSSPFFVYGFNYIQIWMSHFVDFVMGAIADPSFDRPAPLVGWLGVIMLAALFTWYTAGWKHCLLAVAGFLFVGFQGLWTESMETLALTLAAVVIAVVIGVPLGILIGMSRTASRIVTPVLDFMQIMPTFVYLAPLTLIFLIGSASATIVVLIYALPPVIRITGHGIRSVSETTVEASDSLGATRMQTLRKVMIPMARRTIVMGINQTIMAALAMATIAALISAPGLGESVLNALQSLDVGTAFNSGLAIVVLAIVLDRTTTAVSERATAEGSGHRFDMRTRRLIAAGIAVVTLFVLYLSYTYVWASSFPSRINIGPKIISGTTAFSTWVQDNLAGVTNALKNFVTAVLLNPLQSFLTDSPFWLVILALAALSFVLAGRWAAVSTVICLALIAWVGLWQDSMATLAATLVATVLTMIFALLIGIGMGRSPMVDRIMRPILDAAQVMPAFVYLVPLLVLFSPSRFTAIVAAMVYAVPAAAKVVADGIKAVPETTIEAATSTGATTRQIIQDVQLPMAAKSLALAVNQGLIYVLAMVVVGGMVGAGGLGYQVVNGLVQSEFVGKGLAAGFAIVLLGLMLDRVSQAIAGRVDPSRSSS